MEFKKTPSGIIYDIKINNKVLQLYDKQYQLTTTQYTNTLFNGGIGTGKSVALVVPPIFGSLLYPGSRYILGSPTLKMAKGATLQKMLEIVDEYKIPYDFNKSEYQVIIYSKNEKYGKWRESTSFFTGLDQYDRIRGWEYNMACLDEINYLTTKSAPNKGKEALGVVNGRLRYKDPLTKKKFFPSKTLIASSPRGKNWAYEDFYKNPLKGYSMIHATTYENPFLDKQYLLSLESQYTGQLYEQELLGAFTNYEGMIFDIWKPEVHKISKEEIMRKIYNREITHFKIGKDWGFDPDPGVSLVFGIEYKDGRAYYYLMEEVYETKVYVISKNGQRDWISIDDELIEKYRGLGLAYLGMYADKSRKDYRTQYEDEAGFALEKVNNSIEEGVQTIHSFLGAGRLFICSECVNTIKEIEMYQRLPNGEILDAWNHSIDSMRYVIHSSEYRNLI